MAAPEGRTPLSKEGEQLKNRHLSASLLCRLAVSVLRHQGVHESAGGVLMYRAGFHLKLEREPLQPAQS